MLKLAALLVTVQRIVSLSPNATEILHAIGAFDRVVAVSTYCEYPPEVANLPRVGGWTNTNLEQVLVLDPDLVILSDAQAPLVERKLHALGLETLVVGSQSLEDIYQAIDSIGRAVGNALIRRWGAFRDRRISLDEFKAMLTATQTESWKWASVKARCPTEASPDPNVG